MPIDPTDLYGGYAKATRIAPVDRETIEIALKPYSIALSSLKGLSDDALRQMAASAVLARYRAAKATRLPGTSSLTSTGTAPPNSGAPYIPIGGRRG